MRRIIFLLALFALCLGCLQGGSDVQSGGTTQSTVLPRDPRDDGNWTNPYVSVDDCANRTDKYKDLCYINTASNLKDISICDKIQKQQTKELCWGRLGVVTDDPRLCDRISDRSQRSECHLAIEQKGG